MLASLLLLLKDDELASFCHASIMLTKSPFNSNAPVCFVDWTIIKSKNVSTY